MRSESPPDRLVLVVNRTAGSARKKLAAMERALEDAQARVLATLDLDDLDALDEWLNLPEDERPIIVAAGGDGTIGAVAGRLANSGAILGILPLGTSNDVARSLKIPTKAADAVALLRQGRVGTIDIGELVCDGGPSQYFLHAAAMGIDTAFARLATRKSFRARLGPFTYLAAGVVSFKNRRPFDCVIDHEGEERRWCLLHLSVINAPVFGGFFGFTIPGSEIDDRRLDVLAISDMPLWRLVLAGIPVLWRGRPPRGSGVEVFHSSRFRVRAERTIEVSLDGEIAARLPGDFLLRANALRVVTP